MQVFLDTDIASPVGESNGNSGLMVVHPAQLTAHR